mmetsp:Transcript_64218/g.202978  ORF Transcript_64218/g.202978 Transcript_64218/m.202978 type:complete len:231 (-) Transcript_64218:513-1205(-)
MVAAHARCGRRCTRRRICTCRHTCRWTLCRTARGKRRCSSYLPLPCPSRTGCRVSNPGSLCLMPRPAAGPPRSRCAPRAGRTAPGTCSRVAPLRRRRPGRRPARPRPPPRRRPAAGPAPRACVRLAAWLPGCVAAPCFAGSKPQHHPGSPRGTAQAAVGRGPAGPPRAWAAPSCRGRAVWRPAPACATAGRRVPHTPCSCGAPTGRGRTGTRAPAEGTSAAATPSRCCSS